MTDVQDGSVERPAFSDTLVTVTRRGKLVPPGRDGVLALDTGDEQVELLGPFASEAELGDEIEVVGVPTPEPFATESVPGLLVRKVRKV